MGWSIPSPRPLRPWRRFSAGDSQRGRGACFAGSGSGVRLVGRDSSQASKYHQEP